MKHILRALLIFVFILSVMPAYALRQSSAADEAFKQGQYGTAIELYEQQLSSNPDNVRVLKYLGLSYLYEGDFSKAVDTLNRAATLDPNNSAVRFYLAQAYYASGNLDAARQETSYIIGSLPDGIYHQKALELQTQMAKRPEPSFKRKPISLYQRVSYQYDSNVILEPEKLGIRGQDKDSSRFVNYTWVELIMLQDTDWWTGANFSYYQSWHTEHDLQPYNLSSFEVGPFFSFTVPVCDRKFTNRIEYRYMHDILNGDSFCRTHRIHLRTTTDVCSWLAASIFYEIDIEDFFYRLRQSNKDFLDRDAVQTTGGLRLRFDLPANRFIYCGYEYTHNESEGLLWNYERNRLFAEFATPLCVPDLTLFILGEYNNRYFDPYLNSFYQSKDERDENFWSFRVKMRYDFTDWASAETSYRYSKRQSTIEEFFEYERQIFDFSLVFRY